MADPVLYGYWRSSAAYRVRIAANLKGISYRQCFVHLRQGEQRGADYLARNPAGLVPLWHERDLTIAQSLAIILYLDESHPQPPLLPADPAARAVAREIALAIAADVHPLGNLRVLDKLTADFGLDVAGRAAWNRYWIDVGFQALEPRLAAVAGSHAVGDVVSLADVCLVPQVYNARRFDLDLTPYPTIVRLDAAARALAPVAMAAPEAQPDAE
jgi:maleylacetoacetate isomerase